ncbi:MAG: F0F1 ATP synthase subunit delta [Gammaproteobacteria bacterium]|nr:F0F1 ATP synthase subunit delta [Gammaproteobacteria bacterium]
MAELRTLARPYAKAAFAAAVANDELQQWAEQLNLLAALARHDKVAALITSPTIASSEQAKQLASVAGDLLPAVSNFLQVLAEYKRLPLLPAVADLFADFKAERERRIAVNITSAFEVDAQTSDRLSDALKQKLERDVDVDVQVDRALLGGVVVRAGDIVIDASIKGRLAKLAESMST